MELIRLTTKKGAYRRKCLIDTEAIRVSFDRSFARGAVVKSSRLRLVCNNLAGESVELSLSGAEARRLMRSIAKAYNYKLSIKK